MAREPSQGTRSPFSREIERLPSFKNFPEIFVRPQELARLGIEYRGNSVKCDSCDFYVVGNGGSIEEIHRKKSPNCPLFTETGQARNEILTRASLAVPARESLLSRRDRKAISRVVCRFDTNAKQNRHVVPQKSRAGDTASGGPGEFSQQTDSGERDSGDETRLLGEHEFNGGAPDDSLHDKARRLETFVGFEGKADPRNLARSGFYYLGTRDCVRCAFCGFVLRNWDQKDSLEEHRRYKPECPKVYGDIVPSAGWGKDPASRTEIVPPHPSMVIESCRVNSFQRWPGNQPPEKLAQAGLFYTGVADNVCCFSCGGNLYDWSPSDVPWIEHARYFPHCAFVCKLKGHRFIQDICLSQPRKRQTTELLEVQTENQRVFGGVKGLKKKLQNAEGQNLRAGAKNKNVQNSQSGLTTVSAALEKKISLKKGKKKENGTPATSSVPEEDSEKEVSSTEAGRVSEARRDRRSRDGTSVIARLLSLKTQNKELQERVKELEESRTCVICVNSLRTLAFLPCGHFISCSSCASSVTNCPICRTLIRETKHIWF